MSLGTLVVELTANVAKFQSDLGRAEQVAQNTARRIDEQFGMVKNTLATFGVGLASFLSLDALTNKIEGVISSAAGLQDLSERTGATVENLSALASVAKLSGTDTDQLASSLQKLSRAMLDAEQGGAKTSAAFAAIGISTDKLASQRPDEVFVRIATELAKYQDGAAKTALAQELLGKSGANLLPLMKDLVEVGTLQVKVTAQQAQMADEYEKNLVRLQVSIDAIFKKIGLELVPVLNAFVQTLLESQNANDGLRASVDGLAQDGSIRDWAERAAIGLSYFIDVLSVVPDVFNIVGKTIAAAAAQFVALVDVLKGAGQALSGDFMRGLQTAQAGLAQIRAVGNLWVKDMQEIWNRPLFSDRLKRQLEEAGRQLPPAPRAVLPNLPSSSNAELAKKQFEGQIKLLERQIQEEQRLYQSREQLLGRVFAQDLMSIADYFGAREAAAAEYLRNTQAIFDRELELLRAYQGRVTDAKARQEAQSRIDELEERARGLNRDAQAKSVVLGFEQARATRAYTDEVERLNIRLLELQGNLAEAGRRQTALQDRQIRQRLTIEGNVQGLATLDQIEKLESARSAMSELNLKAGVIEERLAATEVSASAQRRAGAISELELTARLSAARSQAAAQLAEIAKEMMAVAQASGDPRMVVNVETFQARIEQVAASANRFKTSFTDNLSNFFTDLASGAKSFRDAFLDMARSIEQAITRIVAQNFAESLFGAAGAFGGAGGSSGAGGFSNFVGGLIGSLFGAGPTTANPTPAVASANFTPSGSIGFKIPAGSFPFPARAMGGDVYPNQAYLVGERGPELFVPNAAGGILPNDRLTSMATPGVVIHNHFAAGTDLRTIDQAASQIGRRVQRAMRRSL